MNLPRRVEAIFILPAFWRGAERTNRELHFPHAEDRAHAIAAALHQGKPLSTIPAFGEWLELHFKRPSP